MVVIGHDGSPIVARVTVSTVGDVVQSGVKWGEHGVRMRNTVSDVVQDEPCESVVIGGGCAGIEGEAHSSLLRRVARHGQVSGAPVLGQLQRRRELASAAFLSILKYLGAWISQHKNKLARMQVRGLGKSPTASTQNATTHHAPGLHHICVA